MRIHRSHKFAERIWTPQAPRRGEPPYPAANQSLALRGQVQGSLSLCAQPADLGAVVSLRPLVLNATRGFRPAMLAILTR